MTILQDILPPEVEVTSESTKPNSSIKEDNTRMVEKKTIMDETLAFAKVCLGYEQIWNTNHPNYHSKNERKKAFIAIAAHCGISRIHARQEWVALRRNYKKRAQNSARHSTDELYAMQKKLFGNRVTKRVLRASTQDDLKQISMRSQMAREILKRDVIWNGQHEEFNNQPKRGQAWSDIATEIGVDKKIVLTAWHMVVQRSRQYRERHGIADPLMISKDPLYELLDKTIPERLMSMSPEDDKRPTWIPNRQSDKKFKLPDDKNCHVKVNSRGVTKIYKTCDLCGKSFERFLYGYHMNVHKGLTPYACPIEGCDRKFSNKLKRNRHVRVNHDDNCIKHKCDRCGKEFKDKGKRDYHFAMKHQSQNIPCPICGKLCKHRESLSAHMRVHRKRPMFTCDMCGKMFRMKHSLKAHLQLHIKEKRSSEKSSASDSGST